MLAAQARGDVSAGEIVERAIRRAQAWQPHLNAFSQLWDEPMGSEASMPVVPVAVKDLFDVTGRDTTGCCAAYRGVVAEKDAPIVERIRSTFHPIGKTNQHELAAGGTNLVSACGRTANPWDLARMTGGSSGGSGAAVAAGIVPVALGSDTGGSIRIPASLCGTFGLKPTTGRLPTEGLMPLSPTMDCPGPMAATAGDLVLLYRAMAGMPAAPQSPGPIRLAVLDGFFDEVVHSDVRRAVEAVAHTFEAAGATIETTDGRGMDGARSVWMDVCTPEFAEAHPLLRDPDRRKLVAAQPREWLDQGERITPEQREEGARRRAEIGVWYRTRLEGVDALLVPTTPYPAPRADQDTVELGNGRTVQVAAVGPGFITCSVNLAGLPALSLPAGRTDAGLPVGVSLVGPDDGEGLLLDLAARWEAASAYTPPRPTLPVP
jgi:aspartyl-tRNA(Asn)/glutamyl-tRNA(Gln) amidotransferase subunit A